MTLHFVYGQVLRKQTVQGYDIFKTHLLCNGADVSLRLVLLLLFNSLDGEVLVGFPVDGTAFAVVDFWTVETERICGGKEEIFWAETCFAYDNGTKATAKCQKLSKSTMFFCRGKKT